MSFAVKPGEPLQHALRRVVRAQLAKAVDKLNDHQRPLSERIHDLRTSLKKVRALLALTRADSGQAARRADRRLRKIAAMTARLRDAEMMLKTFDEIMPAAARRHPASGTPVDRASDAAAKELRGQLAGRLEKAARGFDGAELLSTLAAKLVHERDRAGSWMSAANGKSDESGRKDVARFGKTYRRARRTMKRATRCHTGAAFHDWRKAVKAHRYQLQFLPAPLPSDWQGRLAELERLGELLGDEHDLTVLTCRLEKKAVRFAARAVAEHVLASVAERRRKLRAEALSVGAPLFVDRARLFSRRLRRELLATPANDARDGGGPTPPPASEASGASGRPLRRARLSLV